MKGRGMDRLRVVACTVSGLILAGSTAAQNSQAARVPEKKNHPTVASAKKFLEELESQNHPPQDAAGAQAAGKPGAAGCRRS